MGRRSEELACRALERAGYAILARNVKDPRFEIDIVARHQGYLVFIEVRARRVGSLVHPLESLTYRKRQRLILGAKQYIHRRGLGNVSVRFDVVAVEWLGKKYRLRIYRDVFGLL